MSNPLTPGNSGWMPDFEDPQKPLAEEKDSARRSAADCSQSVIGYRLEDGTNKMECRFLPGRPQQRTLDMVAEHLKAGWILTEVIRPANATRKP